MLKHLRKKGFAKKVIWAVAIVIIIAFGFGGTMYLLNDRTTTQYAGKIFGKKINFDDYYSVLHQVQIQAMIQYDDKFNQVLPFLNLEAEAWDRMILLHEANRRKIKVTDEEVVKAIQEYPFFKRNNIFDKGLYNDILQYWLKMRPRKFEEHTRDTLKLGKLFNEITGNLNVVEKEVIDAFQKDNEEVQVTYSFIGYDAFKNQVNFNETEAIEFFNTNKYSFAIPPSINVQYITINLAEDATEEEKKSAWLKAETVYQDILSGKNLAEVAAEHSLEVQTSGFFSQEKPNLSLGWSYEILNQIFDLDTGEVIAPFESMGSIKIVGVSEKRDAYIPEYEEVKEETKNAVIDIQAKNIAKQKAEETLTKIQEELSKTELKDFTKIGKTLGLDIKQTPSFKRGQYLPEIGLSKDFQEAAFALTEENKLSGIVKTTKGYCILYLDAYKPADQIKYIEEKAAIAEKILAEKKNRTFNEFLTGLRQEANLEDNIAKIKAERQRQLEEQQAQEEE